MRLPSFNDFSPVILGGDIRECLKVIQTFPGNDEAIIAEWARLYFGGKKNKRSSTNIPATLSSTKLIENGRPLTLSAFGVAVLDADSAIGAAQVFCGGIIRDQNGFKLLDAIQSLTKRGDRITKNSLKTALKALGVEKLSTNTTDHTTLKNWLMYAGIVDGKTLKINDALVKTLSGIGAVEHDEFAGLTLPQQIFLELVRKQQEGAKEPLAITPLLKTCFRNHPHLFSESQFAKDIRVPLANAGWITVDGLGVGAQGGKSGKVSGTSKLLAIPIERLVPDFDQVIPADLRAKLNLPLTKIQLDLAGDDKHAGGLALELLALRMIMDLELLPRGFRVRSAQSAFAEVDLTAEGAHLLFSRWTFQCKRTATRVGLSEVAKEVGIALFVRAHVVVMVTTSEFSRDAYEYAREISKATHLQFLFIPGKTVSNYLLKGRDALVTYVLANAKAVMQEKVAQRLSLAKLNEP